MKMEQLAYFLDLASSGSQSKTAEKFYTSHQVVRNAIAGLERELGVTLITTTSQGSQLTAAGEIVAGYARIFGEQAQRMSQELAPFRAQTHTEGTEDILLCVTPYLSDRMLLDCINDYKRSHALVNIALVSLPYPEVLEQITHRWALGLVQTNAEDVMPEDICREAARRGLQCAELTRRRLYLCVKAKSQWARSDFVTRAELNRIPLIFKYTAQSAAWDKSSQNQQFVNSFEAQKELIRQGSGAGIVTKAEYGYYFKPEERFALIPVELSEMRYLCVLRTEGKAPPDALAAFLKAVKTVL